MFCVPFHALCHVVIVPRHESPPFRRPHCHDSPPSVPSTLRAVYPTPRQSLFYFLEPSSSFAASSSDTSLGLAKGLAAATPPMLPLMLSARPCPRNPLRMLAASPAAPPATTCFAYTLLRSLDRMPVAE